MEYRWMKYFVILAEELHFGRAAERIGIAQPALSQQIKKMEEHLGVKLFNRDQKRVSLTEPGHVFLKDAEKILYQVEVAVHSAVTTGRGERGELYIGFTGVMLYSLLPPIVQAFNQRYPDSEIHLHNLCTPELLESLRQHQIQAAIAPPPVSSEDLSYRILNREPMVIALPERHRLTRREFLTIDDLASESILLAPRRYSPSIYDRFVASCETAGFSPNIIHDSSPQETNIGLVATGMGVALVYGSYRHLQRPGVVYRPLVYPQFLIENAIIWRKDDKPPGVERLLEVVEEIDLSVYS